MPNIIEGTFTDRSGRYAIIAGRFNGLVVESLTAGAVDAFTRHGVRDIDIVHVPGAFEIPLVAKRLTQAKKYDAILCLGCVIRGDTDHYDHVAGAVTSGVAQAMMSCDLPMIFGILTCDTLEQALQRAGAKAGNKGYEAAITAIEMVSLLKKIAQEPTA